jgi:predicted transposase YbfD/YdcC
MIKLQAGYRRNSLVYQFIRAKREAIITCCAKSRVSSKYAWVLDMMFREGESRIRTKQGPLVFNVMRNIAMPLFKQDETKSTSMASKRKRKG